MLFNCHFERKDNKKLWIMQIYLPKNCKNDDFSDIYLQMSIFFRTFAG